MALDWVDRGCGDGELYRPKPLELVARLGAVSAKDLDEVTESGPGVADEVG
jgi:hypothetical protein